MKTLLVATLLLCSSTLFAQAPVKVQQETTKPDEKIYTIVEEMPQFPGGQKAMEKFIADTLRYPADMKEEKGRKVVYVTFVVDLDGSLTDIKIIRGVKKSADEEVLRVVKLMPKWIPGKQNGKNVRVQFNLPVAFTNN